MFAINISLKGANIGFKTNISFRFTSEENSTEDESSDKDFQLMSHHSVPSSEDGTDRSSRRKGIDQVDGAGDTDV